MNILSIQSQVVYGHVGNGAALLPLQRQGFEVWAVPTAILAHHPGHGRPAGCITPARELQALLDGLEERGLFARCDGILTGWLGDVDNAEVVLAAIARIKAANPQAVWLCDPVIGDRVEGIYVRPGLPDFFRDRALAQADIVTPNRFELEWLSGRGVEKLGDILGAMDALRARGPGIVVGTSLHRRDGMPNQLDTAAANDEGMWLATTPELGTAPHGAGDLFAALFLARRLRGKSVKKALAFAVAATYGVLRASPSGPMAEPALVAAQAELVRPEFNPQVQRIR